MLMSDNAGYSERESNAQWSYITHFRAESDSKEGSIEQYSNSGNRT